MNKTVKEIVRVIIAGILSFIAAEHTDFSAAMNILMFFLIYMAVALVLEWLLKLKAKRSSKRKFRSGE